MPIKAIRIKVVDGQGRTVCRFRKMTYFDASMQPQKTEPWGAESKPISEKWLGADPATPSHQARLAAPPVRCTAAGRRYLELPGLTLRWERVTPVLERIAAALNLVDSSGVVLLHDLDAAALTIDQLRHCINFK